MKFSYISQLLMIISYWPEKIETKKPSLSKGF